MRRDRAGERGRVIHRQTDRESRAHKSEGQGSRTEKANSTKAVRSNEQQHLKASQANKPGIVRTHRATT